MNNTTVISLTDLIHQAAKHLDELSYTEGTKQHYVLNIDCQVNLTTF